MSSKNSTQSAFTAPAMLLHRATKGGARSIGIPTRHVWAIMFISILGRDVRGLSPVRSTAPSAYTFRSCAPLWAPRPVDGGVLTAQIQVHVFEDPVTKKRQNAMRLGVRILTNGSHCWSMSAEESLTGDPQKLLDPFPLPESVNVADSATSVSLKNASSILCSAIQGTFLASSSVCDLERCISVDPGTLYRAAGVATTSIWTECMDDAEIDFSGGEWRPVTPSATFWTGIQWEGTRGPSDFVYFSVTHPLERNEQIACVWERQAGIINSACRKYTRGIVDASEIFTHLGALLNPRFHCDSKAPKNESVSLSFSNGDAHPIQPSSLPLWEADAVEARLLSSDALEEIHFTLRGLHAGGQPRINYITKHSYILSLPDCKTRIPLPLRQAQLPSFSRLDYSLPCNGSAQFLVDGLALTATLQEAQSDDLCGRVRNRCERVEKLETILPIREATDTLSCFQIDAALPCLEGSDGKLYLIAPAGFTTAARGVKNVSIAQGVDAPVVFVSAADPSIDILIAQTPDGPWAWGWVGSKTILPARLNALQGGLAMRAACQQAGVVSPKALRSRQLVLVVNVTDYTQSKYPSDCKEVCRSLGAKCATSTEMSDGGCGIYSWSLRSEEDDSACENCSARDELSGEPEDDDGFLRALLRHYDIPLFDFSRASLPAFSELRDFTGNDIVATSCPMTRTGQDSELWRFEGLPRNLAITAHRWVSSATGPRLSLALWQWPSANSIDARECLTGNNAVCVPSVVAPRRLGEWICDAFWEIVYKPSGWWSEKSASVNRDDEQLNVTVIWGNRHSNATVKARLSLDVQGSLAHVAMERGTMSRNGRLLSGVVHGAQIALALPGMITIGTENQTTRTLNAPSVCPPAEDVARSVHMLNHAELDFIATWECTSATLVALYGFNESESIQTLSFGKGFSLHASPTILQQLDITRALVWSAGGQQNGLAQPSGAPVKVVYLENFGMQLRTFSKPEALGDSSYSIFRIPSCNEGVDQLGFMSDQGVWVGSLPELPGCPDPDEILPGLLGGRSTALRVRTLPRAPFSGFYLKSDNEYVVFSANGEVARLLVSGWECPERAQPALGYLAGSAIHGRRLDEDCEDGFALPDCSLRCQECLFGGTCDSGRTGSGVCKCPERRTGGDCSQCEDGWTGEKCEDVFVPCTGSISPVRASEACLCLQGSFPSPTDRACVACECTGGSFCNTSTGGCICRNNSACVPSRSSGCSPDNGECFCKKQYGGADCSECSEAFEGDDCEDCAPMYYRTHGDCVLCEKCSIDGTRYCDTGTGTCVCKDQSLLNASTGCSTCTSGYSGWPLCTYCSPEFYWDAALQVCAKCSHCSEARSFGCYGNTSECYCKFRFAGADCSECSTGYQGPNCDDCTSLFVPIGDSCVECNHCNVNNTKSCHSDPENDETGKCECIIGYAGSSCNDCATGYFPEHNLCIPCDCAEHGVCHDGPTGTGDCACQEGYTGQKCDVCDASKSYAATPVSTFGHVQGECVLVPHWNPFSLPWDNETWINNFTCPDSPNDWGVIGGQWLQCKISTSGIETSGDTYCTKCMNGGICSFNDRGEQQCDCPTVSSTAEPSAIQFEGEMCETCAGSIIRKQALWDLRPTFLCSNLECNGADRWIGYPPSLAEPKVLKCLCPGDGGSWAGENCDKCNLMGEDNGPRGFLWSDKKKCAWMAEPFPFFST